MKTRLLGVLLPVFFYLVFATTAVCGPSLTRAEIARLVAEAATYQPGQSCEAFRRIEEWVSRSVSDAATRQTLEGGLVQLLAPSATFEARRFACKQLGIIGGKDARPSLAKLLLSDETVGIACVALTTYPSGKADEALRVALASAPKTARIQIIITLGDRRDSQSVKLLAELARDADRSVAEPALGSLGRIGDKAASQALTSLGKTLAPTLGPALTEATIRCAAGLAASGKREMAIAAYKDLLVPSQPAYVRRAALAALFGLDKDQGEQRIIKVLRGSDATLKPVAIAAVPSLRSKDASEKFSAELPRLQPQEQAWMIESLAARGGSVARTAIAKRLDAPDAAVRRAAITALGRIGDVSSVALFAQTLANSDEADEQRAIESALIELGGGAPINNAIIAELKKSSAHARVSLITVLIRRQGPAANALLFEETDNPDLAVAKAAFRALTKTAVASDVPALLKKLLDVRDTEVRTEAEGAAAQALGKVDDVSIRSDEVLHALRQAQTSESLSSLLTLLPRCGGAKALAVLKAALSERDARVRDTAVHALAEWPDASAWDTLLAIYRQGATETVRGLALRGLVRLAGEENAHPDAKLVERYRQLLAGARGEADLRLILGSLSAAAHPDALQLSLPLLSNAGVRAEAEVAVRKIAESIKAQNPQAAQEALQKIQAK